MVLMLVNLQGAAVIFRVGRHHHHGSFCEGRGLKYTPSQTHLPLTSHAPILALIHAPCTHHARTMHRTHSTHATHTQHACTHVPRMQQHPRGPCFNTCFNTVLTLNLWGSFNSAIESILMPDHRRLMLNLIPWSVDGSRRPRLDCPR